MKIKKYTGDTIEETMSRFKAELGSGGVILNTRTIREPGLLGFFKKHRFEITAAYEEKEEESLKEVKSDLMDLKHIVSELNLNMTKKEELPEQIKSYHRILVKNGVDYNFSFNILQEISQEIDLNKKDDKTVLELIKYKLGQILSNNNPIEINDRRKSLFFIGPTGVGKTTTLAKIASNLVMDQKYDIGLITSDTYRIGAVDQLKIYSEILDLPIEISYDKQDLIGAFDKFKEKDVLLVDTAGRNYNDQEHIHQLNNILEIPEEKDIFLLISATSDVRLLEKLANRYNFLGDYKIIVTKVDEANDLGSIFNIKYLFDREISYYTTGQNVPDDISTVDNDYIIDYLVREM